MGVGKTKGGLKFLVILIFLAGKSCEAQSGMRDSVVIRILDSLFNQDQRYRKYLLPGTPAAIKDSLARQYDFPISEFVKRIKDLQAPIDASNFGLIDSLIRVNGYPGKSVTGPGRMNHAALIILHSNKYNQYITLLEREAEKKELDYSVLAQIIDRSLVSRSKKQIYGTQIVTVNRLAENGQRINESFFWPIKHPRGVNELRKKVGLVSIEQYGTLFGIKYSTKFLSISKLTSYLN